jgi:hypothetical protein
MGWTARIAIAIVVAVILALAALAIYGSTISPPHRTYQQVLPNERFQG